MTPDATAPAVTTRSTRGAGILARVDGLPHSGLIWAAIITAIAFVVLFLRRPETLTTAEFWADDGPFYQAALDRGVATLAEFYAGTLPTIFRLTALAEAVLPPYWAPGLGNTAALVMTALVAAFLAMRLPLDRNRRWAIAALVVLAPGSAEVFGTMSNVAIVLGAFLIGFAFVRDQKPWELVVLAIVAMTGPLVMFVAPVYVGRWWFDRPAWKAMLIVLAAAAFQFVGLLTTPRVHGALDVSAIPMLALSRITHLPGMLGLLVLALVLIASSTAPRLPAVALWYLVFIFPIAGLLGSEEPTSVMIAGGASRYFWFAPGLLATLVIISRLSIRQAPALAFIAVLILHDLLLPPWPVTGWAENSACIRGPVSCDVPVQPPGIGGDQWTVHWAPR